MQLLLSCLAWQRIATWSLFIKRALIWQTTLTLLFAVTKSVMLCSGKSHMTPTIKFFKLTTMYSHCYLKEAQLSIAFLHVASGCKRSWRRDQVVQIKWPNHTFPLTLTKRMMTVMSTKRLVVSYISVMIEDLKLTMCALVWAPWFSQWYQQTNMVWQLITLFFLIP